MKVLYDTILKATYTGRPNRFVVTLDLNGESVLAHLPNPGRMWELLFTGVTMYIVPHDKPDAKTKYRVVGIERDGVVIMLDTNYSNDVAEHLIENKLIPGWEEWRVVRREYTVKLHGTSSRFDLLLTNDKGDEFLLEVKSCTLFSKTGAMFPDAITERGRKHLLHLKELQNEGYHTGVLFLVQWDKAQWFLPDYHTDLEFAMSYFLDSEAYDEGVYIMVMHLDHDLDLEIGSKGMMHFKAGYYMYVGSAKANLTKRIERHKRKRKKMHWHLDYFRGHCEMIAAVPIRTSGLPLESWSLTHEPYPSMPSMPDPDIEVSVECALADAVGAIAEWEVPKFGSSDCYCTSHLFGMMENPIHNKKFMDVIEDFRMNQLDVMVE